MSSGIGNVYFPYPSIYLVGVLFFSILKSGLQISVSLDLLRFQLPPCRSCDPCVSESSGAWIPRGPARHRDPSAQRAGWGCEFLIAKATRISSPWSSSHIDRRQVLLFHSFLTAGSFFSSCVSLILLSAMSSRIRKCQSGYEKRQKKRYSLNL